MLVLFSVFVRYKVTVYENVSFTDYKSGIQLLDCSKLVINWKNNNDVKICPRDAIFNFFNVVLFFLSSLVTSPSFMSISSLVQKFFYKGLTRNPEIGNTPVWVLPNIWGLGQVTDTKLRTNVSIEMLLNPTICKSYSFYRFWVIKGKPTGLVKLTPPPPHPPPPSRR